MEQLQTRCPSCSNETTMKLEDLLLLVPADPTAPGRAIFDCPACSRRVSLRVDRAVLSLLETRGVPAVHGHPSMGPWPGPRPDGPPFTYDDLLDLHLLLERPDWFDELLVATGR